MNDNRSCTCHPDEAPQPCQKRYALNECQANRIAQLEAALQRLTECLCSECHMKAFRDALGEDRT